MFYSSFIVDKYTYMGKFLGKFMNVGAEFYYLNDKQKYPAALFPRLDHKWPMVHRWREA